MTNTTSIPLPQFIKDYRRQLAFDACVQHFEQTGRLPRGGYACIVAPDDENQQHITAVVPLRRSYEAKKFKKKWRKEDIEGSYFHITLTARI